MKQKNNKTKLIIVLFSIVAVTVMLTYLISGKLVLSKGYNNTSDGSNNKVCLYDELKNSLELTTSDTENIIDFIEKNNDNIAVDDSTLKISMHNEYIYKVDFELKEKSGAYRLTDYVWMENGSFKNYGAGSMITIDDLKNIESKICSTCGNCSKKSTCSFEVLSNADILSNFEKNEILSLIEAESENNKVDLETLKISLYDNYIYKVEFELKEKIGSYVLEDYVWKENGMFKSLGAGSNHDKEELETLQGVINVACNN